MSLVAGLPIVEAHSAYEQRLPHELAYEREKADARAAAGYPPNRSFPCKGNLRLWASDERHLDVRCDVCGRDLLLPHPKPITASADAWIESSATRYAEE